jgi:uncharacterized protein YkwD
MSRSTLRLCTLKAALLVALALPVSAGQEDAVLDKINSARAKAGCPALVVDARLQAAAEGHARAMAEQNFFGHSGKDGHKFSSRIKRQGYEYRTAAENIAAGQSGASEVVKTWLG